MTMICLLTVDGFPCMFSDTLLTTSGPNVRFDPPDYDVPTDIGGHHARAVGATRVQLIASSQKMICLEDGCIIGVSGPLNSIQKFLKILRKKRRTSEKSYVDLATEVEAHSTNLANDLAYIILDMNADGRTKFHNVTARGEGSNLKYYACGSGAAGVVEILDKMEIGTGTGSRFSENPDGFCAFIIATITGFEIATSASIQSNWGGWIQAAYPKAGEPNGFRFPDRILFCMWICHVSDDPDGNKSLKTDHYPHLINMSYRDGHLVVRKILPGRVAGKHGDGIILESSKETIFVMFNRFDEKRKPINRSLGVYNSLTDYDAVCMVTILLYGNKTKVRMMWDRSEDSPISFEQNGTMTKMTLDRRWMFDERLGLEQLLRKQELR